MSTFDYKTTYSGVSRWAHLQRLARELHEEGDDEDAVREQLKAENLDCCRPPLIAAEIEEVLNPNPDAIDKMNREYAVTWAGGQAVILREHLDPTQKRDVVTFVRPESVKLVLAPYFVTLADASGKRTQKPLFNYWITNLRRRQYRSVVFEPWAPSAPSQADPTDFNLFRGWDFAPDARAEAGCQLFLRHLREVVCGGNEEHARWFLAWMAQSLQKPNQRPGTAVVMRKGQGIGKGLTAQYYGRIWGRNFLHLTNSENLVGRFNAHLKDALLVFADEIMFGGDRKKIGVLNAIITEDRVMIEPKFHDLLQVKNHMRLMMSTNEHWSIPTGHDARRFFMPDMSEARKDDRTYFDALVHEMEHDGPACLLAYLLAFDCSGIDLRVVPKTAELVRQKHLSMAPSHSFWFEALNNAEVVDRGQMLNGDDEPWQDHPLLVSRKGVLAAYEEYCRRANARHPDSPQIFYDRISETCRGPGGGELMKRFGDRNTKMFDKIPSRFDQYGSAIQERGRVVSFPPLPVCRAAFERWIGRKIAWTEFNSDHTLPLLADDKEF